MRIEAMRIEAMRIEAMRIEAMRIGDRADGGAGPDDRPTTGPRCGGRGAGGRVDGAVRP
jgi:hypothetical protein